MDVSETNTPQVEYDEKMSFGSGFDPSEWA
jgi:hypothetical protein